jgi:3-dehydro-L-gulonate 2-dehydrogenase
VTQTLRLDPAEIQPVLDSTLRKHGFVAARAELCARLFTETSLDGVASHGLARFPRFIDYIERGIVKPHEEPTLIRARGNFENWDGNLGPGNLNAWACMDRAVRLAGKHSLAAVSLRNTNHWMRGGTYGLQAARAGCIGICMTNTEPNMPPWGGREPAVGNNPLVIAVPHEPYPVLLDMAMSQYAYGRLETLAAKGEKLPFPGGFDTGLELSDAPGAILESGLALPMGYWKGSGLALLIDLCVALLSGGLTTAEIGRFDEEHAVSQLFVAFDLGQISDPEQRGRIIREVTGVLRETRPMADGDRVSYPGQRTWRRRRENERHGIPVDRGLWDRIRDAASADPDVTGVA